MDIKKKLKEYGKDVIKLFHKLTREEMSRGGKNSPTNFAKRSQTEVQDLGRRGGKKTQSLRKKRKRKN